MNIMKAEGYIFPTLKEAANEGVACHGCHIGILHSRHHCPTCSQLFCDPCASKFSILPKFVIGKEVLSCEICYRQIKKPKKVLTKETELFVEYLASSSTQQQQNQAGTMAKSAGSSKVTTQVVEKPVRSDSPLILPSVNKFSYTWTIPNFNSYSNGRIGEELQSPEFSSSANDGVKWCLGIRWGSLGLDNIRNKNYLSLGLGHVSANNREVEATFEVSVLNAEKTKTNIKSRHFRKIDLDANGTSYGWFKFIEGECLLDSANNLLPNDTLTIFCDISVSVDIVDVPAKINTTQIRVPACRLSDHIGFLFDNEKWSDITIIIDGEFEFRAHKAILAVRSSIFAAMFKRENETTDEEELSRLYITDMDQAVLREMLRFIYTDEVMNIEEIATELLMAANKYDLEKLKIMCEEALLASLEIENSAHILTIAELYNADHLKDQTMSFITHRMKDFMNTEGYKLMLRSHPRLLDMILHGLVMKYDSKGFTSFTTDEKDCYGS